MLTTSFQGFSCMTVNVHMACVHCCAVNFGVAPAAGGKSYMQPTMCPIIPAKQPAYTCVAGL